jgi:hypothetical protein
MVAEKGVPRENNGSAASHWSTVSHNFVSNTSNHESLQRDSN